MKEQENIQSYLQVKMVVLGFIKIMVLIKINIQKKKLEKYGIKNGKDLTATPWREGGLILI